MHYLVLDLEMTGPEPGWNEIIQIGACLYDENWNELGQYLSNVYPENEESFSSYAEKVHNLSLADLDDAPMIYDVLPAFEAWILETAGMREDRLSAEQRRRFLRDVIICGQSVINDINFLRFAYRHEKLEWPYSHKLIDLHTLSFFLFQILERNGVQVPRSLSLKAVAAFFGFEREGEHHNALEDAVITAKCLKQVMAYSQRLQLKD